MSEVLSFRKVQTAVEWNATRVLVRAKSKNGRRFYGLVWMSAELWDDKEELPNIIQHIADEVEAGKLRNL